MFRKKSSSVGFALCGLVFCALFLLSGCGPRVIRFDLEGGKKMNPDDRGAALPVMVRIYQLKEKEAAEKADFMALWKSDRAILEADLVERQETTLFPEGKQTMLVSQKKGVRYIMVVALVRKHQETKWREIIPVEKRVKGVEISLEGSGIQVKKME